MKFWISDEFNTEFESFDTEGHSNNNLSVHLDAMKIAAAWGYHNHDGFYLQTEDGFIYEVEDPYKTEYWQNLIAFDQGVPMECAACGGQNDVIHH